MEPEYEAVGRRVFGSKPDILPSVKQPTLHTTLDHHNLASYVARHCGRR
jgi:hypothetical protein